DRSRDALTGRRRSEAPPACARRYGTFTQRQPLRSKTQASSGFEQPPLHEGESASPHATFVHSHDPEPTTARQNPPPAQLPLHLPSVKRHSPLPPASVVVVVPPGLAFNAAGEHTKRETRNLISRAPNSSPMFTLAVGLEHLAG